MDAPTITSIALVASGVIGGIAALVRAPKDRESLAVRTQKDVIADMRDLVDELVEALERCRNRGRELEAERRAIADTHQRESIAHRHERERILADLAHLEAQLHDARQRLGEMT